MLNPDYFAYLQPLHDSVVGKVVLSTIPGTSGFALNLSDASWVVAYLEAGHLRFRLGTGAAPPELVLPLISGKSEASLQLKWPPCDIAQEIAHSVGQPIIGIAHGENAFNFCFPQGMELDATIVTDPNGAEALHLLWDQW
jgi:hypothetical protein